MCSKRRSIFIVAKRWCRTYVHVAATHFLIGPSVWMTCRISAISVCIVRKNCAYCLAQSEREKNPCALFGHNGRASAAIIVISSSIIVESDNCKLTAQQPRITERCWSARTSRLLCLPEKRRKWLLYSRSNWFKWWLSTDAARSREQSVKRNSPGCQFEILLSG